MFYGLDAALGLSFVARLLGSKARRLSTHVPSPWNGAPLRKCIELTLPANVKLLPAFLKVGITDMTMCGEGAAR